MDSNVARQDTAETPDTPDDGLPPQLADLPAKIAEFFRRLRAGDVPAGHVAATALEEGFRLGLAARP